MTYQVVAKTVSTKEIGGNKKSHVTTEVKVGDPEKYKVDAETHAQTLRDMFKKMGRHEVEITVVEVK